MVSLIHEKFCRGGDVSHECVEVDQIKPKSTSAVELVDGFVWLQELCKHFVTKSSKWKPVEDVDDHSLVLTRLCLLSFERKQTSAGAQRVGRHVDVLRTWKDTEADADDLIRAFNQALQADGETLRELANGAESTLASNKS